MHVKKVIMALAILTSVTCAIESCEENNCGTSHVSSFYSLESKKMTGDCMNCHNPNGGGSGCFRVGGTAFDSISPDSLVQNAVVRLYTQPNGQGELVVTLQVDKSGNFYTTGPVSFGSGLYPSITNSMGNVRYMPNATTTGACNSCHGVTNNKIWAD
jgi:hypothetical protein